MANACRFFAMATLLLAGSCRRPPAAVNGDGAVRVAQRLYDRTPARVRAVEVDDRNIYWSEYGGPDGTQVSMAPKAGGGVPVRLGSASTSDRSLNLLVIDQSHVYWLEQTHVHRVAKDNPGDAIVIELGTGHGGDGLAGDDQSLYVADLNCTAIGRISKTDLAVAVAPIAEASPLGGVTGIALDASDVFCGRGPNIFVQPRGGGTTTKLVGDQEEIGPVVSDGTNVYWGNNRSVLGTRTENIGMIPRSGATSATDLGPSGGVGQLGVIRLDRKRQRLYWMTCPNASVPITTLDLESKRFDNLIESQSSEGCGFTDDDTHVYWAARNAVMRLPKRRLPAAVWFGARGVGARFGAIAPHRDHAIDRALRRREDGAGLRVAARSGLKAPFGRAGGGQLAARGSQWNPFARIRAGDFHRRRVRRVIDPCV